MTITTGGFAKALAGGKKKPAPKPKVKTKPKPAPKPKFPERSYYA